MTTRDHPNPYRLAEAIGPADRDAHVAAAHDAVVEYERQVRAAEASHDFLIEPPTALLALAQAHALTALAISAGLPGSPGAPAAPDRVDPDGTEGTTRSNGGTAC